MLLRFKRWFRRVINRDKKLRLQPSKKIVHADDVLRDLGFTVLHNTHSPVTMTFATLGHEKEIMVTDHEGFVWSAGHNDLKATRHAVAERLVENSFRHIVTAFSTN